MEGRVRFCRRQSFASRQILPLLAREIEERREERSERCIMFCLRCISIGAWIPEPLSGDGCHVKNNLHSRDIVLLESSPPLYPYIEPRFRKIFKSLHIVACYRLFEFTFKKEILPFSFLIQGRAVSIFKSQVIWYNKNFNRSKNVCKNGSSKKR